MNDIIARLGAYSAELGMYADGMPEDAASEVEAARNHIDDAIDALKRAVKASQVKI